MPSTPNRKKTLPWPKPTDSANPAMAADTFNSIQNGWRGTGRTQIYMCIVQEVDIFQPSFVNSVKLFTLVVDSTVFKSIMLGLFSKLSKNLLSKTLLPLGFDTRFDTQLLGVTLHKTCCVDRFVLINFFVTVFALNMFSYIVMYMHDHHAHQVQSYCTAYHTIAIECVELDFITPECPEELCFLI